MWNPIQMVSPDLAEMPTTADVALCCGSCLDTLTPAGHCLNVGACFSADSRASIGAARTKLKAPRAWTIRGNID